MAVDLWSHTQSEPVSIGETSTCVMEDAGTVYHRQKFFRLFIYIHTIPNTTQCQHQTSIIIQKYRKRFTVLGHDRVSVWTAVAMDVFHSFGKTFDYFDSAFQSAVFRTQRLGWWRSECQVFTKWRSGINLDLSKIPFKFNLFSILRNSIWKIYSFILEHGADVGKEWIGATSISQ